MVWRFQCHRNIVIIYHLSLLIFMQATISSKNRKGIISKVCTLNFLLLLSQIILTNLPEAIFRCFVNWFSNHCIKSFAVVLQSYFEYFGCIIQIDSSLDMFFRLCISTLQIQSSYFCQSRQCPHLWAYNHRKLSPCNLKMLSCLYFSIRLFGLVCKSSTLNKFLLISFTK